MAPGEAWLSADERETAAGLRFEKRRSDWRVGRWAAKHALAARLGLAPQAAELARLEIRNDPEGAPSALRDGRPLPVPLSISHRDGAGLCALAPPGRAIGCDLEVVEPRDPAFVADYFGARERAGVAAAPEAGRVVRVALVWSAKEAALKALGTGLRRDTRELHVEPAPGEARRGWRRLAVEVAGDATLAGWWRELGERLLTVVTRPAGQAPEALLPLGGDQAAASWSARTAARVSAAPGSLSGR